MSVAKSGLFFFISAFIIIGMTRVDGSMLSYDSPSNSSCVLCTAAVTVLTRYFFSFFCTHFARYTEIKTLNIDDFIKNHLCKLFPTPISLICDRFVDEWADKLILAIETNDNPDDVCGQGLGICEYPQCRLFTSHGQNHPQQPKRNIDWPDPIKWLKEAFENITTKHTPVFDHDGDMFSSYETLRGASWRGKDCNDKDSHVYPGRIAPNLDEDDDCNGVFGIEYNAWCLNSSRIGIVGIGDSISAKFHFPPEYLDASLIEHDTYRDLLDVIENEVDNPQYSWITGHLVENEGQMLTNMSVYGRMVQRNRCNHRDFQNLGVNGMRLGGMNESIATVFQRNGDYPVIAFVSALGNDICNSHIDDPLKYMTTPEAWRAEMHDLLSQLDQRLPPGSQVMIMKVIEEARQYEILHNRSHPISPNVTYSDFYDYLNCLRSSPCGTYLNSDPKMRDLASQRAIELNLVTDDIVSLNRYKYSNFDLDSMVFPTSEGFDWMVSHGYEPWQAFEAVDGFHPSSVGNAVLAMLIWDELEQRHPDWIGPVNPYNEQIIAKFGDQGGY